MGFTTLNIEVGSPVESGAMETVEVLVDSGAMYSVIPSKILKRLGIKPIKTEEFRLANGQRIIRKKGVALFKYQNYIGGGDVIFGERGDVHLLGVLTLEALGLSIDPIKRQLIPYPLMM